MTSDRELQSGDRDAEVTAAFGQVGGRLARGLSGAIGLLSIAYLVGWRRATGFCNGLSLPWMTDDIQSLFIIRLAEVPLLFLAIGVYSSFADAVRVFKPRDKKIIGVTVLGVVTLNVGMALFGFINGQWDLAVDGATGTLLGFSLMAGSELGETVLAYREVGFRWTSQAIRPLAVISFSALIGVPWLLGQAEGKRATDPSTSTLPYVAIANEKEPWRLLHAEGDRLYIGILRPKAPPLVRIVSAKDVTAIEARRPEKKLPSPSPPTPRSTLRQSFGAGTP